jgi:hypothetical protein
MSRRHLRALTLVLLALLIAAPLSSGDKGLWLSLTSSPVQLFESAAGDLPAEHAVLVPERASRAGRAQALPRGERLDAARILGLGAAVGSFELTAQWALPASSDPYPHGEPSADRPAPRAPPA